MDKRHIKFFLKKLFERSNLCCFLKKKQYALKRPNAVYFSKKNEIKPFEDEEKLEFFSRKNDTAHLVIGTHSKKRPHNLTFVRMYNHTMLDMYEFGIENPKSMNSIPVCF